MKKYMASLLILCMAFSLIFGGAAMADGYTAGTYSATAKGNNGDVTVSVTVDAEKITGIELTASEETVGLGDVAAEKVIAAILEGQTLAVDTVSGATNTSAAVLAAAEAALTEAGADIAALKTAAIEAKEKTVTTMDTSLVIVGAGGAGIVAGITALENGMADVVVLEKMAFGGGATLLSEGYIAGGNSAYQKAAGVTDDVETIIKDLYVGGKEQNQMDLLTMYAENMGASFDWMMEATGLKLTANSPLPYAEHSNPRIMIAEGGGSAYFGALMDRFTALGGTVIYDTRADEILMNDGKAVGVHATTKEGDEVIVNAKATLITTGGFGASPELRPAGLEGVVFYGASSSTGDGIVMGEAIGAKTVLMDYIKIYPNGILYDPDAGVNADGALNRNGISCSIGCTTAGRESGAIMVNKNGERFVNENGGLVEIKEAQMAQDDMKMFLVMDQRGYDAWYSYTKTVLTEEKAEAWFANDGEPIFVRSTSLDEAAQQAGIHAENLKATIEAFNANVKAGNADPFGRSYMDYALEENTWHIVELKMRTATTLGGLKTNDAMQVLDTADQPITGLYAAGEVVGAANGIESMPSCMNGWSLVSARQAAQTILAELAK